jgi:hypothetical protein
MKVMLSGLEAATLRLQDVKNVTPRAAMRAVNKTAEKGNTLASRAIRSQVNLTAGYVKDHLRIAAKATEDNLTARIVAEPRPVLLSRFGATQLWKKGKTVPKRTAGVSVKVKAGGARKKLRGAFFIRLKDSGALGVAVRVNGSPRNEIDVLHGPSVDQVFRSVREDIAPELQDYLTDTFRAQLQYELSR